MKSLKRLAAVAIGTVVCAQAGAQPAASAGDAALPELAFVSIRSGDAQIFIRDAQGKVRALTSDKAVHTQPAWAVNNRLAYTVSAGAITHVVVTDTRGAEPRRLTAGDRLEISPSWSPDGDRLALFSRGAAGGKWDLQVVDARTGQATTVASAAHEMGPTAPSWSADGRRLAFVVADDSGKTHIWVGESDGSGARQISKKFSPRGGATPDISPDGRKVAWIADARPRRPVVVTDIESGESQDLSTDTVESASEAPRWSPDGKQIAFASLRDDYASGRNDVFVMNADGSEVRNLSRHPGEDFNPKWSADGRSVVFASLRSGTSLLYEVSLESGQTQPVSVHGSHDMDHVVRPQALLGASPTHPSR